RVKQPNISKQSRQPYRTLPFWIVCVVIGFLNTSGIVAITHLVAYAQGHGMPVTKASLLLSVFGLCAAGGALFYGWLADRLTPVQAIIINGILQVAFWVGILFVPEYPGLLVLAGALGTCTGGTFPLCSALMGRLFDGQQFGSALGQLMLV